MAHIIVSGGHFSVTVLLFDHPKWGTPNLENERETNVKYVNDTILCQLLYQNISQMIPINCAVEQGRILKERTLKKEIIRWSPQVHGTH